MTTMQYIEHAVGEYQWPRQLGNAPGKLRRITDFGFEGGKWVHAASLTRPPAARKNYAKAPQEMGCHYVEYIRDMTVPGIPSDGR